MSPRPVRKGSRPASLRIIGGSLRGSRLAIPDVADLRPTPDRVRETLFNWLAPIIHGARCLDLYAGTGALGIEALSRGAASCRFVERDARLAQNLRDVLQRLDVRAAVVDQADALQVLRGAATPCDLVFVDPPFSGGAWDDVIAALEQGSWLADGALLYVESPAAAPAVPGAGWAVHRQGRAGDVAYALYRRAVPNPLS